MNVLHNVLTKWSFVFYQFTSWNCKSAIIFIEISPNKGIWAVHPASKHSLCYSSVRTCRFNLYFSRIKNKYLFITNRLLKRAVFTQKTQSVTATTNNPVSKFTSVCFLLFYKNEQLHCVWAHMPLSLVIICLHECIIYTSFGQWIQMGLFLYTDHQHFNCSILTLEFQVS